MNLNDWRTGVQGAIYNKKQDTNSVVDTETVRRQSGETDIVEKCTI